MDRQEIDKFLFVCFHIVQSLLYYKVFAPYRLFLKTNLFRFYHMFPGFSIMYCANKFPDIFNVISVHVCFYAIHDLFRDTGIEEIGSSD